MLTKLRATRKKRIRAKVIGNSLCPRLSVFRSNKFLYVQLIDDEKGETIAEARGEDPNLVGEDIAKKAMKKKINSVVFDRSGYRYHGKVKAIADAARKGGLKF